METFKLQTIDYMAAHCQIIVCYLNGSTLATFYHTTNHSALTVLYQNITYEYIERSRLHDRLRDCDHLNNRPSGIG